MVTTEQVLKEFNPIFGIEAPPKPDKLVKFNVFYWHRRYPIHKPLGAKARIDEKIKNGDFEYSPYAKYINYEYWWMAEEIAEIRNSSGGFEVKQEHERNTIKMYNRRIENLRKDFERDEKDRMDSLKSSLRHWVGGTKEQMHTFIYKHAEGTTEELVKQYREWLQSGPEKDLPY